MRLILGLLASAPKPLGASKLGPSRLFSFALVAPAAHKMDRAEQMMHRLHAKSETKPATAFGAAGTKLASCVQGEPPARRLLSGRTRPSQPSVKGARTGERNATFVFLLLLLLLLPPLSWFRFLCFWPSSGAGGPKSERIKSSLLLQGEQKERKNKRRKYKWKWKRNRKLEWLTLRNAPIPTPKRTTRTGEPWARNGVCWRRRRRLSRLSRPCNWPTTVHVGGGGSALGAWRAERG